MVKLDLENVRVFKKEDIAYAMNFLGKMVYVSDTEDFEEYGKFKLVGVKSILNSDECFIVDTVGGQLSYNYLIPATDAKFIDVKPIRLRPFKSSWEFTQETGCDIGDVITIRRIDNIFEESCIVNGYKLLDIGPSIPHRVYVVLGANEYSFEKLMRCFDYLRDGKWYPFGVEE